MVIRWLGCIMMIVSDIVGLIFSSPACTFTTFERRLARIFASSSCGGTGAGSSLTSRTTFFFGLRPFFVDMSSEPG